MSTANQVPKQIVRADAARRASDAWGLRVAGRTWDEVAQAVGFHDAATAHRAVMNYFGTVPQADREQLRTLARARGEKLWQEALTDVLERRPGALRAAVAVLQRQAQLDGLDQPSRVHVEVGDDDLRELVAELSAMLGANGVEVDPLELTAEVLHDD